MSKKKLEIIIFFISIFSIILYFKSYKNNINSLLRKLNPTNNEIEEICKKGSYDLYNYYYQENKNIKEPKYNDKEDYILSLIQIIDKDKTNKKENMKIYIKHLLPSLIILCLTFISLIIWVLFLICGMCKKCKKCSCFLKPKCKSCIYILLFSSLFGSFILSINGVLKTKKLVSNLDKISCSMLRFIYDITEGQKIKSQNNKWSGIDGINNLITKLNTLTSNLATQISNLDVKVSVINGDFNTYKTNLHTSYTDLIQRSLVSIPLIGGNKDLIPIYIKNYGPESEVNTVLNLAKKEIETIKNILETTNNNVKSSFGNSEFSNTLTTAKISLQNLKQSIDQINNDLINPLYQKNKKLTKNMGKLFKSFYIISLILNSIFIILNVCFFCECFPSIECIFKLFIHLIWNCLALIMLISVIISAIFSIICALSKDVVSVAHFSLSSDNLNSENPKIVKNFGNGKEYIDICINGDHNLMNNFFGSIGNNINDLLSVETSINSHISYLKSRNYPIAIETFEYNIHQNNYINKFMDTLYYKFTSDKELTDYNNDDIYNPIMTLTDVNSKILSCNLNEIWMNSNTYPNYQELSPSLFLSKLPSSSTNYLINLYNYDLYTSTTYESNLMSRYSGCSATTPTFQSYFDIFEKLYTENKNYLNNKILLSESSSTINDEVKTAFTSIKTHFIQTLESAINIIVPTRTAFENSVNGGDIKTMLNCTFIKSDLIMLYNILYNDLGDFSHSMSIYMILFSGFLLFQIFFTLIGLNLKNINEIEESEKEKQKKSKKGNKETNNETEINSNNEFIYNKE